MTLRELIEQHPEWADLPIVVYREDGHYDYVGCSGTVYEDEDRQEWQEEGGGVRVLVVAGN